MNSDILTDNYSKKLARYISHMAGLRQNKITYLHK